MTVILKSANLQNVSTEIKQKLMDFPTKFAFNC